MDGWLFLFFTVSFKNKWVGVFFYWKNPFPPPLPQKSNGPVLKNQWIVAFECIHEQKCHAAQATFLKVLY